MTRPSLVPLRAIALAALSALALPGWAIDLQQAYQAALEQDAVIRAARATAEARGERVPQARAQLLPNISASASRFRNDLDQTVPNMQGRPTTTNRNYTSGSAQIVLRQPLFRKYQWDDYKQAKAQAAQAQYELDKETQSVSIRVSTAYFEALLAEEQLALMQTQRTAVQTQLDAARKRFAAGAGTRTDIDEAQAALDLNTAQELEARQALVYNRRQLQSLVNREVDRLATLDPQRMRLRAPNPDRLEEWTARAEANSPELQALRAQLEAARLEVEKARDGHLPTLDAVAQISRSTSDTVTSVDQKYLNRSLGVQLNVPIYSGGYVNSTVRQALAEQERASEQLEATRRDLALRVEREYRGVTEGILRVRALEQAVRSAEQAVISNRRSYEAGARTLVDTLNAEQQRMQALRDLAQARFVYLLSHVRLLSLAGGPKDEVIAEINGWLRP
jgi:TolC family type I secretion outer membrane protein